MVTSFPKKYGFINCQQFPSFSYNVCIETLSMCILYVCVCVCLCLCVPVCVSVFVGEVFVPITLMFLTVIHANSTVVLMYNVV